MAAGELCPPCSSFTASVLACPALTGRDMGRAETDVQCSEIARRRKEQSSLRMREPVTPPLPGPDDATVVARSRVQSHIAASSFVVSSFYHPQPLRRRWFDYCWWRGLPANRAGSLPLLLKKLKSSFSLSCCNMLCMLGLLHVILPSWSATSCRLHEG